jgi:hypothetical protein
VRAWTCSSRVAADAAARTASSSRAETRDIAARGAGSLHAAKKAVTWQPRLVRAVNKDGKCMGTRRRARDRVAWNLEISTWATEQARELCRAAMCVALLLASDSRQMGRTNWLRTSARMSCMHARPHSRALLQLPEFHSMRKLSWNVELQSVFC